MYNAKGIGPQQLPGRTRWSASKRSSRTSPLETNLRQAEDNGELRVYLPAADRRAASEDIVGMEALVRWDHPELGMISPGFFIPLAEETGLIVGIGEWVLRTACEHAQAWRAASYGLRLRVGVNLSAMQLMPAGACCSTVAEALERTADWTRRCWSWRSPRASASSRCPT